MVDSWVFAPNILEIARYDRIIVNGAWECCACLFALNGSEDTQTRSLCSDRLDSTRKLSLGQSNVSTPVCHSVHRWGCRSLYDITCLAVQSHIPSRGLCACSHAPSKEICLEGLCLKRFSVQGRSVWGICLGGLCPERGLCLGVSVKEDTWDNDPHPPLLDRDLRQRSTSPSAGQRPTPPRQRSTPPDTFTPPRQRPKNH